MRNRKVCELELDDGAHPLESDEIGRAYETPDGTLVPISDQELDDLPLPTAKTVEIRGFVKLAACPVSSSAPRASWRRRARRRTSPTS